MTSLQECVKDPKNTIVTLFNISDARVHQANVLDPDIHAQRIKNWASSTNINVTWLSFHPKIKVLETHGEIMPAARPASYSILKYTYKYDIVIAALLQQKLSISLSKHICLGCATLDYFLLYCSFYVMFSIYCSLTMAACLTYSLCNCT